MPPDDRDNPFKAHRRVNVILTRLPDHHRIGRVQEVSGELGVEVDLDPAQPADARLDAKPKVSAEARAGWHTGFSAWYSRAQRTAGGAFDSPVRRPFKS